MHDQLDCTIVEESNQNAHITPQSSGSRSLHFGRCLTSEESRQRNILVLFRHSMVTIGQAQKPKDVGETPKTGTVTVKKCTLESHRGRLIEPNGEINHDVCRAIRPFCELTHLQPYVRAVVRGQVEIAEGRHGLLRAAT